MIGSKFSRHFFNQSEVKPKPIVARACTFSRALCRLRVITSSFDWFTGLPPSFLIGQSNYFWFWFYDTRLKLALTVQADPNYLRTFAPIATAHPYSARKFTCPVMHRARALSTKMNNDRANGHCYSFAWI